MFDMPLATRHTLPWRHLQSWVSTTYATGCFKAAASASRTRPSLGSQLLLTNAPSKLIIMLSVAMEEVANVDRYDTPYAGLTKSKTITWKELHEYPDYHRSRFAQEQVG